MKSLVSLILFAIVAMAVALCTSSCTEEIFIDRWLKGDSIPYPVYVLTPTFVAVDTTKECVETDTLDVHVEIGTSTQNGEIKKDTLISVSTACYALIKISGYTLVPKVVKDSIVYQDRIVYKDRIVHDTLWQTKIDQRVIYKDTLYVLVESRQVFYVPDELMPYVSDFYTLAGEYGNQALGGMLLITYAKEEDMPGEGWTSYSFRHGWDYSQMIIQISEKVPHEQARSCVYREMARLQLKRKYVTDVNKIMCPLWDVSREITQNDLDVLFNPLPI